MGILNFITLFWIFYAILIILCGVLGYYCGKMSYETRGYFSKQYLEDLEELTKYIQIIEDVKLKIVNKE